MKTTLLLWTIAFLAPAVAQVTAAEPPSLETILKRAIIPEMTLQDCPIQDALIQLEEAIAIYNGWEADIKFLSREDLPPAAKASAAADPLPKINLRLANAPAEEVLRYVTELSNCQYLIWNEELLVFPQHKGSEIFRLGVFPVSPFEAANLKELGITVFKEGLRDQSSLKVTEFLGQSVKLGLETPTPPFENWGIVPAPGAFAALLESEWSPDYLVVYDREENLDLIDAVQIGAGCVLWMEAQEYEPHISYFESFEGWERVEEVLKLAENHPESALVWTGEVQNLAILASSLEQLANNPDALDIKTEEIPPRIQAIRQKMLELADRYIDSLRTQQSVAALVPQPRLPEPQEGEPQGNAFGDLGDPFEGLDRKPEP